MKKLWVTILSLFVFLGLCLLLAYIFIATILGYILTDTFGTKTTVGNAALTPNNLKLWHLKIANPPKTKKPYALIIGRIKITAPIATYAHNDIVIEQISLDNLTLDFEYLPGNGKVTNWDEIVSNTNTNSSKPQKNTQSTTIKELSLNNITVHVINLNGEVKTTKIKNLTFRNLSTKNGDITVQIAKTLLFKMIFNVNNIVKFPIKMTKQSIEETLKDAPKTFEKIIP